MERVSKSYDAVAERYADELADELERKPLDRALLRCFAELTAHVDGPVADIGCGPGHVTSHLADLGCDVMGVDVSARMVEVARRRFPALRFEVGSILELSAEQDWAGAVALYSLIHLSPQQRAAACERLARAIRPGGTVLFGFHVSDEAYAPGDVKHLDEWWDQPVDLDTYFLEPEDVTAALTGAGFTVSTTVRRAPLPGEYPSHRCYLLATR